MTGALAADGDTCMHAFGNGNYNNLGGGAELVLPRTVTPWAGDWTIEGWVRPKEPPPGWNDLFFEWEDYMHSGFRVGWTRPDMVVEFWTSEAGASTKLFGTTSLPAGEWSFIAVTKQGSTVTIYVNGRLGSCHGMPSDSDYDEFAVFAVALPADAVLQHYDAAINIGRRP
ncbi:MAG: hypothetical protein QM831_09120 [Kofleriaceae bacterium]